MLKALTNDLIILMQKYIETIIFIYNISIGIIKYNNNLILNIIII